VKKKTGATNIHWCFGHPVSVMLIFSLYVVVTSVIPL